jgi:lysyl-tRNA synthetase class 1
MPFRHAIALGQIVQWDADKVMHMLEGLGMEYDRASVESRLPKAKVYLEKYNKDEMVSLLESSNKERVAEMDEMRKLHVTKLSEVLESGLDDIPELEKLMYDIPKNETMDDDARKIAQRSFFKDVYQLLIGKDTGPRLSTFLWAIDRKKAIELLQV